MLMSSSNDYYHRLKQLSSRYQPRKTALGKKSSQAALMNEDLSIVIEDIIPRHNFMKTVTLQGSKSASRINGGGQCMQIVDNEEMVEQLSIEGEGVIEELQVRFNPDSTGSMVIMDSVKQEARDSYQQVMSATTLQNLLASTRNSLNRTSLTSFRPSIGNQQEKLRCPTTLKSPKPQNPVKRKRWQDLYEEDRLKKERIMRQSSEYESVRKSLQMQHCTFHPQISKSPQVTNKQQCGNTPNKQDQKHCINTIFQRQLIWKKERDLRVEKMQNDKSHQIMKEHTFKPVVTQPKVTMPQRSMLEGSMRAVEQFISRMAKAKKSAEVKRQAEANPRGLNQPSKSPKKLNGYGTTATPSPRSHQLKENVPDNYKVMSTSPSLQQLSSITALTPRSTTYLSRSPMSSDTVYQKAVFVFPSAKKIIEQVYSAKPTAEPTLSTSLYLNNKYSQLKQRRKSPKALYTKNDRERMDSSQQSFYTTNGDLKQVKFEKALSKLHTVIQDLDV